jgi:hypothetical protein
VAGPGIIYYSNSQPATRRHDEMHFSSKKVLWAYFRHCQILDPPVGDAVAFPKSYEILERPAHPSWFNLETQEKLCAFVPCVLV